MEQYDDFLTRFKKDLWAKCVEQKVFDYIPENKLDKTKEVFEMNVSNYQTQILQQDGQNNNISLYPTLIRSIQNDVNSLKDITRDNVQQQRQESFEQEVDSKQQEFNTMMNKNVPPTPQFGDETSEEPLNKDSLDRLIQKQMKDRETIMNVNGTQEATNKIVSNNEFTQLNTEQPFQTNNMISSQTSMISSQEETIQTILNLLKVQSGILQKIVQSQITILKKLK